MRSAYRSPEHNRNVGDAPCLIQCAGGNANLNAANLALDGRTYSSAVLQATRGGILTNASGAFSMSGAVTGPRVRIQSNGVIDFGNFALASIPGTSDGVIDSGGVYLPGFGEVVERGGNSNGQFIRYANGAQICSVADRSGATSGRVWTYPAAFLSSANVSVVATPVTNSLARFMTTDPASNGQSCTIYGWQPSGSGTGINFNAIAIGRWK